MLIALLAAVQTAYTPASGSPDIQGGPLRFEATLPTEIDDVPALRDAMRAQIARERARATAFARSEELAARRGHYPFNQHGYEATWRVEGRTARLVSLSAVVETYTGGGHSEHGYHQFIWDVATAREVARRGLFTPALVADLRPRFCTYYAIARSEHFGEAPPEVMGGVEGQDCPFLASLGAAPADRDNNGRFDTWRIYINTGNFDVEGFTVDMPIEAEEVALFPEAYRGSFEAASRP